MAAEHSEGEVMSDYEFSVFCFDSSADSLCLLSALAEWVDQELTPADRFRLWDERGEKMKATLEQMEVAARDLRLVIDQLEPVN